MNMRTTLMLMAASVAPIYAQQPTATAEQVYTSLATPSAIPPATPAQRAAAYPALALIPANVEALFTFNNIGSTARALGEMSGETAPKELLSLQSIALAASEGMVNSIKALEPWMQKSAVENYPSKLWAAAAANPAKDIITRLVKDYTDEVSKAAVDNMSKVTLPPVYAVLTATPEGEAMLTEWYNTAVQGMQDSISPDEDEAVEINGYVGIKTKIKGERFVTPDYEYDFETGEVTKKELTEDEKAISAELDKRCVYVLLKQQGNALMAVVCEDPSAIVQVTGPESSVLGTNKLAEADANLAKNPTMLCWGAANVNSIINKMQFARQLSFASIVQQAFAELAGTDNAAAATWKAAADSISLLTNTFTTFLTPEGTTPDMMQIWQGDNSIELQYSTSANGFNFAPGKLTLTAQADKPGNIFYTESTLYGNSPACPSCDQLLNAVVNVVDGFAATLAPDSSTEAATQIAMAKSFLPQVQALFGSLKTIGNGLGNSIALTIDSAGRLPAMLGGTPGNTAAMPRLCLYSGVTDRSKLSEGWDALVKTAGEVATKLGSDPSVVNMLPIVAVPMGNAMCYSVAMPWFTPDMVPNVAVTDTAFTIGTSSDYNTAIAAAATGNMPFAGTVCSIKFAPLATTARGIADELQKAVQQEKEPLTLGVEGEASADEDIELSEAPVTAAGPQSADDDSEDYIEEDDYEEEDYYVYHEPSPAEKKANQADEIADACEAIAKYVERVDSTSTVNNNVSTLRVSVKLKK